MILMMNEWITTATDWAQVNTTKSEGSSAICGPHTWKSGGQLTPWTPWLRGPWSAPHNRSHINPWCFAAEQMLTQSCSLHFDSGYSSCALITFLAVTQHTIYSPSLPSNRQFLRDFSGIAAGSDCLHDYCGSPDTFQGRLTPIFTLTSESWKRITTTREREKN